MYIGYFVYSIHIILLLLISEFPCLLNILRETHLLVFTSAKMLKMPVYLNHFVILWFQNAVSNMLWYSFNKVLILSMCIGTTFNPPSPPPFSYVANMSRILTCIRKKRKTKAIFYSFPISVPHLFCMDSIDFDF